MLMLWKLFLHSEHQSPRPPSDLSSLEHSEVEENISKENVSKVLFIVGYSSDFPEFILYLYHVLIPPQRIMEHHLLFFFFFPLETVDQESLMKTPSFKHKLQSLEDRGEKILSLCRIKQNEFTFGGLGVIPITAV